VGGDPQKGIVIDWHSRYLQQATWTRPLRDYLFERCGLTSARRILEIGCGTGAILGEFDANLPTVHGLDFDHPRLGQARRHAPHTQLLCGDAEALPYADHIFDITFCHFLLLWVRDPLQALREMKRVTRSDGYVLAFAEPDYLHRIDHPPALISLGRLQTQSLRGQGADPGLGQHLADLFQQAGIEIVEAGQIQTQAESAPETGEMEWAVLENDLSGMVPADELQQWKLLDQTAWSRGERILHIPTYFAFGKVSHPYL